MIVEYFIVLRTEHLYKIYENFNISTKFPTVYMVLYF